MRTFVTGGTGLIGREVIRRLVAAGHQVTALNRSPEKEELLRRLGAEPVPGDIRDPDGYRSVAAEHEGLIHCAFDESDPVEADRAAVETLLEAARVGAAAAGAPRWLLYTSGCWVLGDTGEEAADEDRPTDRPAKIVRWRVAHERRVLECDSGPVATAVLRPGVVYGGPGSLTAELFRSAAEDGAAAHVGSGENHWSMVYRGDLARLYALLAERRATGVFHGVDERPLPLVEVARAASHAAGAGGAVRSIPLEEARRRLGGVADALCLDQRIVARRSDEAGWTPEHTAFPEAADIAFREWRESRG